MNGPERLFFAVPLTDAVRSELRQRFSGAVRSIDGLRAIPPENWHLTLRFLGSTPGDARARAIDAMGAEVLPSPFSVRLVGWGVFPRPSSARVLWIGVRDEHNLLAALNAATERAACGSGFDPEARRYSPHLTVGRFRNPRDARSILPRLPEAALEYTVDRVVLYRSHLGPGGARYEEAHTFPLPE